MSTEKESLTPAKPPGLLAIGGSAGCFQLVMDILALLPSACPFPVVILIHRGPDLTSGLVQLFSRLTPMKVREVLDKEEIKPGILYIPPLQYHLLAEPEMHWSLDASDPVWYCRPSIDVLFESLADVYKEKATAILLSGANRDGAYGLKRMKDKGAFTIVEDPSGAEYRAMPDAALSIDDSHHVMSRTGIMEFCRQLAVTS